MLSVNSLRTIDIEGVTSIALHVLVFMEAYLCRKVHSTLQNKLFVNVCMQFSATY